jgi:uncharacterized protein YukE
MADGFPPPIAAAIGTAYRLNAGLGAQVETAAQQSWGDPSAIRAQARSWTRLATRVDGTAGEIEKEIRSLDQDWDGIAADSYMHWMRTLKDDSIEALSGQFRRISTILDGTADDVSIMNQQFTDLCTYFVAAVAGQTGPSRNGQAGAYVALAAGVQFCERLIQFQSDYAAKFRPHTQALRQIAAGIEAGSIGRPVQHLPDQNHPSGYYTQELADRYQWHILGDWRNWKVRD